MSHFIYADHAATTAVSDTALQAMLPHFTTAYGCLLYTSRCV